MTIKHIASRKLSRPNAIWCLFALILACITIGLISLSEHALRLGRERTESQQRERLQQDTVVALWRLDSRLGPFISTLLDPPDNQTIDASNQPFVKDHFTIVQVVDGTKKRTRPEFVSSTNKSNPRESERLVALTDVVSASAIINAANQVLPHVDGIVEANLSQSSYTNEVDVYASNLQYNRQETVDSQSQLDSQLPNGDLELLNRNMAV